MKELIEKYNPNLVTLENISSYPTREMLNRIIDIKSKLDYNTLMPLVYIEKIREETEPAIKNLAKTTIEKIISSIKKNPDFLKAIEQENLRIAQFQKEITTNDIEKGVYDCHMELLYTLFVKHLILEGLNESMTIIGETMGYLYTPRNLRNWGNYAQLRPHRAELLKYNFRIIRQNHSKPGLIDFDAFLQTIKKQPYKNSL